MPKIKDINAWVRAANAHGAVHNVQTALANITANSHLNAFTTVLREQALARAAELDRLPIDNRGLLHGVPVVIKDENDVAGTPTTFGTACNSANKSAHSLTVARLENAGAIIIAKTTMPAFGAFPFTESAAYGITRNPVNPAYTPGGSSGGSAAAVAAGIVPAALGGDGGGSIRIPAERCGLVGFKPARGKVSTAPYAHLWHDLGTAGPLTTSVADARLMYQVLTASADLIDEKKHIAQNDMDFSLGKPLKIAVNLRPASPFVRLNSANRDAVFKAASLLQRQGHSVQFVDLKHTDPTLPFVVQFFAGILDEIKDLERPEKIEKRHRWVKVLGFWARGRVLQWAKHKSHKIGLEMDKKLSPFDVLLTPTCADRPAKAGVLEGVGFVRAMLKSLGSVAYTVLWNVSGHAALTLPVATDSNNLPVSVQLIAATSANVQATYAHADHDDSAAQLLFAVGAQLEKAVDSL